ncbi:hypothetical protein EVAR_30842_1 [Eumeta japonica]|uniref:Uncharacterized protein n=1 Tax=Eumeta variegata TaxID=151549 RepID=A0A4C1XTB4_EUMVA|nr:hypothetical protein EVAR_30842_1 [Eumeta japonica]
MYGRYDVVQLQLGCKDDMDVRLSQRNDFESIYYKALSIAHDPELKSEVGPSLRVGHVCLIVIEVRTTITMNCGIVSASDHAAPATSLSAKSSDDIALSGGVELTLRQSGRVTLYSISKTIRWAQQRAHRSSTAR